MAEIMRAALAAGGLFFIAACKPPATDEYVERVDLQETSSMASAPLPSPDTSDAVWAGGRGDLRLIYGTPGKAPVLALACELDGDVPIIRYTRFARADPGVGALFALIGNGITARIPIDSVSRDGNGKPPFLWEGTLPAASGDWEVLTGPREITATLPGAGMLNLKPGPRPASLIRDCRAAARPAQAD